MDTSMMSHMFLGVFKDFESLTKNPEVYLQPTVAKNQGLKSIAKTLHDLTVLTNSLTGLKSKSLPKLLIDGFDEEQVWQQIEIQNKNAVTHLDNAFSKINTNSLNFGVNTNENITKNGVGVHHDFSDALSSEEAVNVGEEGDLSDEEDEALDDYGAMGETSLKKFKSEENESDEEDLDDDDSDDYIDMEEISSKKLKRKRENSDIISDDDNSDEYSDMEKPSHKKVKSKEKELGEGDDDSDEHFDMETISPKKLKSTRKDKILRNGYESDDDIKSTSKRRKVKGSKQFRTQLDDQFFKLARMGQFLRVEDLKEERARDGELKPSDDEDIDLFQDIPSDDLEESDDASEDENVQKKSSKDLMYEDFFDIPESGDESLVDSEQATDTEKENLDFDKDEEDLPGDDNDSAGNLLSHPEASNGPKSKTPFELQQEKTNEQISKFEKDILEPKPWQLTGEVDVSNRPIDALLHLQTDFEMNAKPIVIEDKPLCEKLESMLKMTIKNKSYSDGVKQFKASNELIAQKKEVIIEQTKSKKSLAQEYEDMYQQKLSKQEEEENPKHKVIQKMMDSLFAELQAQFSHIPKPAIPDIKIVSNLPAILAEDVAPTSVSDVTLLAPEEVKKRSGLVKGMNERTDTDRKRERRKKKVHQKLKYKKSEKDSEKQNLSGKAKKQQKLDTLKKIKQHRNTKISSMDGEKIKSSKHFFERLQETVNSKTKAQTAYPKKKKNQ